MDKYLILQHLSKSEKLPMKNNFKIIFYFNFVGSLVEWIFGRQRNLWGFTEKFLNHHTCQKPPALGKLFCCVHLVCLYTREHQTSEHLLSFREVPI